MGQTLAAHAFVMAAVLRLWGVVSATACFEGSTMVLGMMRFAHKPNFADVQPLSNQLQCQISKKFFVYAR